MKPKQYIVHVWKPSEPFTIELAGKERVCIELQCQYRECRATFIVHKRTFLKDTGQVTRPCPYCFRTHYLPGQERPL